MSGRPHKWRDCAWKQAIIDGARDAIAYFMPDLASDMDASREITSVAGVELPRAGSNSDKGMLVSDIFLDVPVTGGDDWSVVCLAEQQHEEDKDFAAQMFDSFVRLRAQRPAGRTTGFAIYTGSSKNVNSYTEYCYGFEAAIKFRAFHLPSYRLEELSKDKRPFALVMYAGYLSLESGDDAALRERYALELLNSACGGEYDKRQRKYILDFAGRVFWLNGPGISQELKEAYNMRTMTLEECSRLLAKEEGMIIGMEKEKFDVARKMLARKISVSDIVDITGLNEKDILSL
jgi:hypothetical protein